MENEWDAVSDVVSDDEWNSVSEVVSEDEWGAVSSSDQQTKSVFPDSPKTDFFDRAIPNTDDYVRPTLEKYMGKGADWVPELDVFEVPRSVAGGAYNAVRNAISGGLALGDAYVQNKYPMAMTEGRGDSMVNNTASLWEQYIPEHEPEDMDEQLATSAVEIGIGALGGAKVASSLPTAITKGGEWARKLTQLFVTEAGGTLTSDIDTEPLIMDWVSENAPLINKVIPDLGTDPEGNFSEEILKRRVAVLADAMLMTKAGELALRGGASGLGVIKSGLQKVGLIGSPKGIKLEQADKLAKMIIEIEDADTAVEVNKKLLKLADALEENAVVQYGDTVIERDSMTAIEKSLAPDDSIGRAKVQGIREGVRGPKLDAKLGEPSLQTEKMLNETEMMAGGPVSSGKLTSQVQEDVATKIGAKDVEIQDTKNAISMADKDLEFLVKNDVELGAQIDKLAGKVDIDVSTGPNVKANKILEKINKASEKMTELKNKYFREIPNEAVLDVDSIKARYTLEGPDGGPSIESLLSPETKSRFEALINSAEDEFDKINFNKLVQFADFDLSDEISRAVKTGDYQKAKELRSFRRNLVQDQLEFLRKSGQPGIAAKAEKAYGYYSEYAPFWRQGPLENLQDLQRTLKLKPDDLAREQRRILKSTLADTNAIEDHSRLLALMKRPEARGSEKLISDFMFSDVLSDAQSMINKNNGKLLKDDYGILSAKLEKYAPVFNKTGHTKQVNKLLNALKNKQFSKAELEDQLAALGKSKEELQKDLYGKFDKFFTQYGTSKIPTQGDQVWTKVFQDDDLLIKLPDLVDVAKKNGNIEGLQSALVKDISSKLFRSEQMRGGAKKIAPIDSAELNKLFSAAEEVFKNTPEVVESMRGIIDETLALQRSRGGKVEHVWDFSTTRKGASSVADFVITQIWGPLNRAGARIRSATGRVLAATDPADVSKNLLEEIAVNPKEFARLIRENVSKSDTVMTKAQKKNLYKWVTATGLYGGSEEEWRQAVEDTQTDQVFPEKE